MKINLSAKSKILSNSITERLGSLFILANASTVLLTFAGFLSVLVVFSLRSFTQELRSITLILASTSRAAVTFQDPDAGARVLSALKERKDVSWAALVDTNGKLLVEYGTPLGEKNTSIPPGKLSLGFKQATISEPIVLDDEPIGAIIVEARLTKVYQQLLLVVVVTAIVGLIALVASYYFLKILRAQVATPIQNLKQLAQVVSVTKDFSQRLATSREDEINELIKAFNHMLAQLEERDQSLVLAKNKAESADRAKSMFVASMSHELRTPLHAILGITDEVLLTELSDEQRDLVNTVSTAGKSLLSVINDVLDFSKIEAGKLALTPSTFSLNDFMSKMARVFQHLYKQKGVSLSYSVDLNLPTHISVDEGRLSQVLTNLLGNALKFTPQGGSVSLRADLRSETSGSSKANQILFTVSDTGIGIDPDQLRSIFEAFTQAHAKNPKQIQGTGLGLAIASRLVKLMGGWIWAESAANQGSHFRFVIDFQVPAFESSDKDTNYEIGEHSKHFDS